MTRTIKENAEQQRPLVERSLAAVETFPRDGSSVPVTRQFVRDVLADWQMLRLTDAAELIVSELVTNAVLHTRTGVLRVTVRCLPCGRVKVAVIDKSRDLPELRAADDDADHGRGLAIVDACSQQWGADPLPWGKRVWAVLEPPSAP
ncbi:ATP-binding protein [Streptomyces sp. Amel2xC10]|uniref:ATP-binding protein n=1 Tax=Streptomyces sp. Amel2xC10 TaxID=1305826 RepID=UPI000A08B1B2|nr:ATP-binding protein [Streptomyces sp. Amel2xC10]SMF01068.1 Anti-sigma regulatory factor (Ser/Thr protein kinase) [Streptomyces sp. Amel2xC10]